MIQDARLKWLIAARTATLFMHLFTGGRRMKRYALSLTTRTIGALLCAAMVIIGAGSPAMGTVYTVSEGFSGDNNPNGAWAFGWRDSADTTAFNIYTSHGVYDGGVDYWYLSGIGLPSSGKNETALPIPPWQPGEVALAPGFNNYYPESRWSLARWTAPAAGDYIVHALFTGFSASPSADVHVILNGTSVFDGSVVGNGDTADYAGILSISENDVVDFVVGDGGSQALLPNSDWTKVSASLTTIPEPASILVWLTVGVVGLICWRRRK